MYKYFSIILLLIVFTLPLKVNAQKILAKSNTYAVVIGITGYENKAIPPLSYADKDARLFAEWLKNNNTHKVAEENLKLFLNEDATIANIYESFNWLKTKVSKDDYVYLYFSGHGDIETDTLNSKGYLLVFNSPPNNYTNNAIAVADVNNLANALTTQNQGKVILITDACHSGKLAGDFYKGRELTAENLRLVLNNQVRLAACNANELAAEGPGWGGGRGVFSYYLLKGLEGFAKPDTNGLINVESLETYLDSSFKTDEGLKIEKLTQHPVIDGSPIFPLTFFDSAILLSTKNKPPVLQNAGVVNSNGLQSLKSLGEQPIDYFFSIANKGDLDTMLNYKNYVNISASLIPQKIVSDYLEKLMELKKIFTSISKDNPEHFTVQMNKQLFERNEITIQNLKTQLENNNFLSVRFNEILVQLVHKKCQTMVNAYLNGDLAELEKRQYYNTNKNPYQNFLALMQIAINITPENNYLYKILNVNKFYLTGLEMRMQMAVSKENADRLLGEALTQQKKALELEPFAAYIQNEIGNLYMHKNNFDSALYYFNYASALAPTWAIPYSNKIRLYFALKKPEDAYKAVHIADSLQPNLAFVNVNAGLVMEKDSNWLAAEAYYLNAIAQNNFHYLPFERLGFVYLNTGNYSKAETYFEQANLRKKDFAINDKVFEFGIEAGGLTKIPAPEKVQESCNLSAEENISGWENYITLSKTLMVIVAKKQISKEQIKLLNILLEQDTHLPFAAHYIGKEYFLQKNYVQAQQFLLQSIQNQIPEMDVPASLINKLNKTLQKKITKKEKYAFVKNSCLLTMLESFEYNNLEDYYMLANIYEENNKLTEAINLYKEASKIENARLLNQANYVNYKKNDDGSDYEENLFKYELPIKTSAALKIASLYEQLGKLDSAEIILLNQVKKNQQSGFARQAQINKGMKGVTNSPVNIFWLLTNEDFEAATFNFYSRMLAQFPRDAEWYKKAGLFLYNRLKLTYEQIPLTEQKYFYSYSLDFPYPYRGGEEGADATPEEIKERLKITNIVELPASGEKINIEMKIYDPLKSAVNFIKQGIKYSGEKEPAANLILCLAQLNSWMGNSEEAINFYKEYLIQQSKDTMVRNQFIAYLTSVNNYVEALAQLDILKENNTLNKHQFLQLAAYKILSNKNKQAKFLLDNYVPSTATDSSIFNNYQLQILINTGNYAKAIAYVTDTSKFRINSSEGKNTNITSEYIMNDNEIYSNYFYTEVRLYALLHQQKIAKKILKNLVDSGMVYMEVLKNDPVLAAIRKDKMFIKLMANYNLSAKKLPVAPEANNWRSSLNYRIPQKDN